jgi:hypothetical protein
MEGVVKINAGHREISITAKNILQKYIGKGPCNLKLDTPSMANLPAKM